LHINRVALGYDACVRQSGNKACTQTSTSRRHACSSSADSQRACRKQLPYHRVQLTHRQLPNLNAVPASSCDVGDAGSHWGTVGVCHPCRSLPLSGPGATNSVASITHSPALSSRWSVLRLTRHVRMSSTEWETLSHDFRVPAGRMRGNTHVDGPQWHNMAITARGGLAPS
jgi:hypothetical protein